MAQFAWDLLKQPRFKSAYLKILGKSAHVKWLEHLPGPSAEAERVTIAGEDFLMTNSCKPHACNTDNIAIFYSQESKHMFIKLRLDGKKTQVLGTPPKAIQTVLDAYYAKRFQD